VRVARPDGSIEKLDCQSDSIQELFGTEGQFGILTEITLRVRSKPEYSGTCLFTFDSPDRAMEFIERLHNGGQQPSHIVFFDRSYMIQENRLFQEQTGRKESVVPEQDAVLLHFETPETEKKFLSSLDGKENQSPEIRIAARYLWADRYFPLKAQRIGPGLLGSEVVIPQTKAAHYIAKVRKLARPFNIQPAIEVIVCRHDNSCSYLVIVAFSCDYAKFIHYLLSLLFIQLSVRLAVRQGGHPYGIGIWNTPFVQSKYSRIDLDRLRKRKREIDPYETLNPNKFFKIKGRFHNIPARFMHPLIFQPIMASARFFTPVLGLFARLFEPARQSRWDVPGQEDNQGKNLLHQSAQRCTSCGSCISVCPAYHITRDELVAGRTKLRMAEAMMNGIGLESIEAHAPFQCLHCGLCEEVCQTHLPLRDCYLVLESWLENRFGSPAQTVQQFIEKLDSNRDCVKEVFGLDLPDWDPGEKLSRVPVIKRPSAGDEA
ncbi:MAG: 4Fe-4S dicluster domain-containing protein, partial [Acidobacteria bacterium]|nr:4Fe-4S dicluster domain-containing protein [Acidobacteriota bacterium]